MIRASIFIPLIITTIGGCIAPNERLSFPAAALEVSPSARRFDTNGNGKTDFSIEADQNGRLVVLSYDDDEDGRADRIYRLSEYAADEVPHLIILLDSIPFQAVADRYRDGSSGSSGSSGGTWFDPPQKVIPPFPTMSPIIFSRMLGAPPLPGMINQYYDRNADHRVNRVFERSTGRGNPWERRLDYRLRYWENGLSFLDPRPWYRAELQRAKAAFDACPTRVCIVYLASTSCMLSKYGSDGLREVLDGIEQICMQVMYERRGAVKISALADHGHNLVAGTRIDLSHMLKDAGFHTSDHLRSDNDVVVELDGLVNYAGIHTRRPEQVAAALCAQSGIELAMYMQGDRVIVRDNRGAASIERRGDRFRYVELDHDVLEYTQVVDSLRAAGKADDNGFATARDWFDATVDHHWPDAPVRLWEAFHVMAVNTPDVMITTRTGYFVGLASMEWFIDMASTHGGLNQVDSATFVLTMTGRAKHPMRTEDVMKTIEPSYDPSILHH